MPVHDRPKLKIALVWTQFIPYHLDRADALAIRLAGQAEVLAIEVASVCEDYAAFAAAGVRCEPARITLFPGKAFEALSRIRRLAALLKATRDCQVVCIGIPYSNLDVVVLAWILRLLGRHSVLMIDSKFDDKPRSAWFEMLKWLGLGGFAAAVVASSRSADYIRFLGFRRRPVLPGCDTLALARIRSDAETGLAGQEVPFEERPFVFVGRFVGLKNIPLLLDAFADFVARSGNTKRQLLLVGSGPIAQVLRDQAEQLGIAERTRFAGFQIGPQLAASVASSLALVLPSYQEPWGLVINEALALGIPVIVSNAPGARDLLVQNLINGFVIENGSREGLAEAMVWLDRDRALWQQMADASRQRAHFGDVSQFADAVEVLLNPTAQPAGASVADHLAELGRFRGREGQFQ